MPERKDLVKITLMHSQLMVILLKAFYALHKNRKNLRQGQSCYSRKGAIFNT